MREMERLEGENPPGTPILVHTDLEVVDENLRTIAPSMFRLQNLDSRRVSLSKLLAQMWLPAARCWQTARCST